MCFFLCKGSNQPGSGKVLLRLRRNLGEHGLNALEAIMNLAAEYLHQDAKRAATGPVPTASAVGLMRSRKYRAPIENRTVFALYMMAGPSNMRTAFKIVGHAGHDVARPVLLDSTQPDCCLQMTEKIVAQVELNLAGNADDDPSGEKEKYALEDGDGDQQAGIEQDLLFA